jgi:hypothetical protein
MPNRVWRQFKIPCMAKLQPALRASTNETSEAQQVPSRWTAVGSDETPSAQPRRPQALRCLDFMHIQHVPRQSDATRYHFTCEIPSPTRRSGDICNTIVCPSAGPGTSRRECHHAHMPILDVGDVARAAFHALSRCHFGLSNRISDRSNIPVCRRSQ